MDVSGGCWVAQPPCCVGCCVLKSRSKSRTIAKLSPFPWNGAVSSLFFLTLSLIFLAFSLFRPTALSGLRAASADVFAPAFSAVSLPFQSLADLAGGATGLTELRAKNTQLTQENARLKEWYQSALRLQAENQSLRDLLHVKLDPVYTFLSARVVADGGNSYVKSVLVSAGSRDGIREGQAVLSGQGLVGRIAEAGLDTARVVLLNDFNARVPVLIEGTHQRAILAGTNEESPVLMYLPPDSTVPDGARVVTSGDGGVFPPGLAVGSVKVDDSGVRRVSLFSEADRLVYVRIVHVPEDPRLRRAEPEIQN